jgi:hypothetical protein
MDLISVLCRRKCLYPITTNGKYLYTTFDQFIYKGTYTCFQVRPRHFMALPSDTTSNQLTFKSTYMEALFGVVDLLSILKVPYLMERV